jgi:hypothetical protein
MNPVFRILEFIFGCRHRHLSRVFTIRKRAYKVCFDCGEEFDMPGRHSPSAVPGLLSRVRMEKLEKLKLP